jgi:hypothetical protein
MNDNKNLKILLFNINSMKTTLEELYGKENELDEAIIIVSQQLDILISEYMRLEYKIQKELRHKQTNHNFK